MKVYNENQTRVDRKIEDYFEHVANKEQDMAVEIMIEKKNNQIRRDIAKVKVANFPCIKTMDDFDFDFQSNINKKEMLELYTLDFLINMKISFLLVQVVLDRLLHHSEVISIKGPSIV